MKDQMKISCIRRSFIFWIGFILLFFVAAFFSMSGKAQDTGWSNPINLSNTPTDSLYPSLAVDAFGNVHITWIEEVEPGFTVVLYSRLDEDGWSTPVDIFASSDAGQIDRAILLGDSKGKLHIFYNLNGIQYSWAYADQAGSAQNWTPPETVVLPINNMTYHHAVSPVDGSLHLVYDIAFGPNSGIYYLYSPDNGETWSDTAIIYRNTSPNQLVSQPIVSVSKSGKIHVVWDKSDYPETFPPTGILYSSSIDGKIWEPEISLAEGPYTEPTALAVGENEVHVVWSGTDIDRFKFHRYSKDDGITWTDTWRNTELGGLQGLPALVSDSLNNIYWLKVGTIFDMPVSYGQIQDSLHENKFIDGAWGPGQVLLPSSYSFQNQMNVSAVIAKGNELHTVVMNPRGIEGGGYQFDIYYLRKNVDAPEINTQPVLLDNPIPQTILPPTLEQSEIPILSNSPSFSTERRLPISSMSLIIISTIPALAIVFFVLLMNLWRKTR